MNWILPLSLIATTLCTEVVAQDVNNVIADMTDIRAGDDYIYIAGGVQDGAGVGQTTAFIILPSDDVLCVFTFVDPFGEFETTRDAHRFNLSGSWDQLSTIMLPNIDVPASDEPRYHYTVEADAGGDTTTSFLHFDDPRQRAMIQFFYQNRTPCWMFG